MNRDLQNFLNKKAILSEQSARYIAAQNGSIERDIGTIKEAAQKMPNKSELLKNLRPQANDRAVYVLNRTIRASDRGTTPYRMWFVSKPSVKRIYEYLEN